MDSVFRALIIYLVIVVLFRMMGKRTMAELSTIDLVLLLIISEATQQALLGDDFSVTTSILVVATLVLLDRAADILKFHSRGFSKVTEGTPLVLVQHGRLLMDRLRKEHIAVEDVLVAARSSQGLLKLEQIEYAILETSGTISIIPASERTALDREADHRDTDEGR
ncbi:DUF421 domain-containing protein [Actinophytocola glycyrrhizae]|uniref:DUF421 domain-containing protein n=1 Tax=Actinophytocola glycyrrhizae TaxID=2044873 RepID=A0ABV9RVT0_9PSEU